MNLKYTAMYYLLGNWFFNFIHLTEYNYKWIIKDYIRMEILDDLFYTVFEYVCFCIVSLVVKKKKRVFCF